MEIMLCGGCLQIPSYNGCGFVWWLIKGGGGMMELNALDFVNKYKDLLTDGVVVDPVLS